MFIKLIKKCEVKNEDKVNQFYKDKTKLQKQNWK